MSPKLTNFLVGALGSLEDIFHLDLGVFVSFDVDSTLDSSFFVGIAQDSKSSSLLNEDSCENISLPNNASVLPDDCVLEDILLISLLKTIILPTSNLPAYKILISAFTYLSQKEIPCTIFKSFV